MMDDMDDGAAIEWLMVNVDPREHSMKVGSSGECPWWQLVYPWWFGQCPRNKLPASAFELPNRDWRWRFRGFCPNDHQTHRYRLRVFAQGEWDQGYLRLNWPRFNADDVARQLVDRGQNLGVGTLIANGGRKRRCAGPYRTVTSTLVQGIVADFDFSRKTLQSIYNGSALIDIGNCTNNKNTRGKFLGMNVRGQFKTVFFTRSGYGLTFNVSGTLNVGDNTEYSVVMDVRMSKTNCYVRLLNVNSPNDFGLYLCGNVNVFPDARVGPYIYPNSWYHIILTTRPDKLTEIFVQGKSIGRWFVKADAWRYGLRLPDPSQKIPIEMTFFNDCGKICGCSGGFGEQSDAMVNRIQIYNRAITADEAEYIFIRDTMNPAGLL